MQLFQEPWVLWRPKLLSIPGTHAYHVTKSFFVRGRPMGDDNHGALGEILHRSFLNVLPVVGRSLVFPSIRQTPKSSLGNGDRVCRARRRHVARHDRVLKAENRMESGRDRVPRKGDPRHEQPCNREKREQGQGNAVFHDDVPEGVDSRYHHGIWSQEDSGCVTSGKSSIPGNPGGGR